MLSPLKDTTTNLLSLAYITNLLIVVYCVHTSFDTILNLWWFDVFRETEIFLPPG